MQFKGDKYYVNDLGKVFFKSYMMLYSIMLNCAILASEKI